MILCADRTIRCLKCNQCKTFMKELIFIGMISAQFHFLNRFYDWLDFNCTNVIIFRLFDNKFEMKVTKKLSTF